MKRKIGESKEHWQARLFRTRTYSVWSGWKQAAAKLKVPCVLTVDELREKVRAAVGRPCRYCGEPITLKEFSGDHQIPASSGGGFDAANLDIICRRDNETKGRMSSIEYSMLCATIATFSQESSDDVKRRLRMGSKAILSTFWGGKRSPDKRKEVVDVYASAS